ncbi:hypothetical protein CVT24_003276 [Panaeolus cyanescens]|uniref:Uncharacterized protein n=1 Tax=Panaeolus cyanescens TaxID=181874 RepID=A0A409YRB6_9AGAR|nr:hypothetical protein CVT24_003276 [Panaeolus cyanescens]
MDVVSSVYTLTVGIVQFIAEHETKDNTISQIWNTTVTIQQIIKPLLNQKLADKALQLTIQGLQVTLRDINDHLVAWEHPAKKMYSVVNPWALNQELKGDLDQLMRQYLLLVGALQAFHYTRSYTVTQPPMRNTGLTSLAKQKSRHSTTYSGASSSRVAMSSSQVGLIWQTFLGKELDFCRVDAFINGLCQYMQRDFSSTERQRLLLKLDEKGMGYIFYSSFVALVGPEQVAEAISYYASDPRLPLLVWIDDSIRNNKSRVEDARKYGVTVVQLTSTGSAKRWLTVNKGFLRKHDNGRHIRYITDQVRIEPNENGAYFENWHAGDQIVDFIRKEMKLRAPILVYTNGWSLSVTRYVDGYTNTGSLAGSYGVFRNYVFQLGARKTDTPTLKFNMSS